MEKYLYTDLDKQEKTHFWHVARRKTVLEVLKKYHHPRHFILDLGCGTGQNLKSLCKLGKAFGVDISKEAINFCKKKGLKNVKQARSEKIPFPDKKFDLVTMFDVLEHVEENKSLQQVRRVLKQSGQVLITVPAHTWLWSRWDEVLHHKRRYSIQSLTKALNKQGFKIVFSSYMFSFLVPPAVLTRFIKSLFYKDHYPSDFRLSSPWINKFLIKMSNLERPLILRSLVPIGTSLICLAVKK